MKRKTLAIGLAVVLSLSMSLTSFAASSSTTGNSSTKQESSSSSSSSDSSNTSTSSKPTTSSTKNSDVASSVNTAKPGQKVDAKKVNIAVTDSTGNVSTVSVDQVVNSASQTIIASAETPEKAVVAVQSLLTTPVTPFFTQTVEALAVMKGSAMVVNNCGTIKTAATAVDPFGNVIASAGVVKHVTTGSLVMLMSVNADGTVEYVEGVVDPVTGVVMGAFKGTPTVITVLVLA